MLPNGLLKMHKRRLTWGYEQGDENAPFLDLDIFVNEMLETTFQFCLWAYTGENNIETYNQKDFEIKR